MIVTSCMSISLIKYKGFKETGINYEENKMSISKTQSSQYHLLALACSILLNVLLLYHLQNAAAGSWLKLSWSRRAAAEAEAVAEILCSGHGRAFLDGLVVDGRGQPVCECNSCYGGHDCTQFFPNCPVNADGGDPLFLEPFWKEHAESSGVVVAGWHRMSYSYKYLDDSTYKSMELEKQIRQLHSTVGNAVTPGRYIIFGAGSTQLLNAAVHAFSLDHINRNSSPSSPARVVASIPFYLLYQKQTKLFESEKFKFEGDASLWKNRTDISASLIEFVTAPNNPDGQLNQAVLRHQNAKAIYDHAYYWPHFTPIPAPADNEISIFTLSKLTGHAGSRFGWAIIKDKTIYERMSTYLEVNTIGVSRDTQLRTLKLLKVVNDEGAREFFEFGHVKMSKRWKVLSNTLSSSKRFSLQKIAPQYCIFSHQVRDASPAYAWVKCEREEDKNCYDVLLAGNIKGRKGKLFHADDRYVRLSLLRSQDDFQLMIQKLNKIVLEEQGPKTI